MGTHTRVSERAGTHYTVTEDDVLRQHYGSLSLGEIAQRLGRTATSVHLRAGKLGVRKRVKARVWWTAERDALVRAEWRKVRTSDLAARIGCTVDALRARAQKIGVAEKMANPPRAWRRDELRVLREMYGIVPTRMIAQRLGRSADSVLVKAQVLGLHQSSSPAARYQRDQATIDHLRILLAGALEMVPADRVAAALGVPLADLPVARATEAVRGVRLVQERERRATASEATP